MAPRPASSGGSANCASSVNGCRRRTGHPQVVYVEGEAGAGKSTLLSGFLGSLSNAVVLEVAVTRQRRCSPTGSSISCSPGRSTEPGTDPMAVGARLLDLLDRLQADGQVVVLAIDDLQWADRPSSRAVLFALRRLRADKVLGGRVDAGRRAGRSRLGAVRGR